MGFQENPDLRVRLGRSKNHFAKSTSKQLFHLSKHKGRQIPVHVIDKLKETKNTKRQATIKNSTINQMNLS